MFCPGGQQPSVYLLVRVSICSISHPHIEKQLCARAVLPGQEYSRVFPRKSDAVQLAPDLFQDAALRSIKRASRTQSVMERFLNMWYLIERVPPQQWSVEPGAAVAPMLNPKRFSFYSLLNILSLVQQHATTTVFVLLLSAQ